MGCSIRAAIASPLVPGIMITPSLLMYSMFSAGAYYVTCHIAISVTLSVTAYHVSLRVVSLQPHRPGFIFSIISC